MVNGNVRYVIMSGVNDKFLINKLIDPEENPYDRQERITWWDQKKLINAKVMVVGAGAIGNETLKNLALLGIGNIYVVDFDVVSISNLSRTVLFRKKDKGKNKAEVAAHRTKDLSLLDDVKIHWFHGDAVWDLGTGLYRSMDVVLGCLDNVETRFAINRQCWLAGTPWIDSGIYELGGHVSVFVPPEPPCYQCAATEQQLSAARKRYSCDDFKRAAVNEGKMPTVQVTSSLVSAIQVQEAIKLLCGQRVFSGRKIYFQGILNDFDIMRFPVNSDCTGHVTYPDITSIPLTHSITLREFLEYISSDEYSGSGACLDFRADRTFIISVMCRCGNVRLEMNKPSFRIYDTDTICKDCDQTTQHSIVNNIDSPHKKNIGQYFSLTNSQVKLLNMRLSELGIPNSHIVAVYDVKGNYKYYQLAVSEPFFNTVN
ncbi:MAG: HesA/MoeB/ThiF family protein [Planctomycetes bacterium]|nr:HesA/MoeB/ThiF family protein [Planctomycetota bacterium]